MSALINDLLNLSRMTRTPLRKESISLTELARGVVAELHTREPSRNVAIEIADGLSARGDKRLITIALVNLLGNAWKYTAKRPETQIAFGRRTRETKPSSTSGITAPGSIWHTPASCSRRFSDCTWILSLKALGSAWRQYSGLSRDMVAASGPRRRSMRAPLSFSP